MEEGCRAYIVKLTPKNQDDHSIVEIHFDNEEDAKAFFNRIYTEETGLIFDKVELFYSVEQ
jgi:hypothetical protein